MNTPDIVHRQVQLLNAQIPYSFYVINYTNQLLKINTGYGDITYTIPVGNYTANSLISAILLVIDDVDLSITISSIDGKLTFSHASEAISFFNNIKYSIGNILGFPANTIIESFPLTTLTTSYPLNLLGIKTLQIRSANLIMNNVSSIEGGQTILLANIPVSAVPFGMIEYTDKGNLISIANQDLDDIAIELVDGETGNLINMNGQDWCITLAFHLTKVWTPPFTPNLQNEVQSVESVKPVKHEQPATVDEQQLSFLQS